MDNLSVDIITPEAAFVEQATASSLIAPGYEGELEILPLHTTFLSSLEMGRLVLQGAGAQGTRTFVIQGGFLEVGADNHVRVLADQVQDLSAIDRQTLQERKAALEEKLEASDPFSSDHNSLLAQQRFIELQESLL